MTQSPYHSGFVRCQATHSRKVSAGACKVLGQRSTPAIGSHLGHVSEEIVLTRFGRVNRTLSACTDRRKKALQQIFHDVIQPKHLFVRLYHHS